MKAMILAAGRGSRMGNLSDDCPKVLLPIAGKAIIDYHLENLARAKVTDVVINLWYLPEQIRAHVGDGSRYGLNVQYSPETELLGMGGGVYNALPYLGDEPFIVVSGDMWTQYEYAQLPILTTQQAHLVLTPNPPFHPQGDYGLIDGIVQPRSDNNVNFAGVGVYHPDLFRAVGAGNYGIVPVLETAIAAGNVSGEYFTGPWANLNTPDDLANVRNYYENP